MSQIILDGVSLTYKGYSGKDQQVQALNNLSLEIYDNEFLCLLGQSGCGKTTVINLVAGFLQATGGSITMNGQAIGKPGPDRGVVFQESALFPWLTVLDNVAFGLREQGVSKSKARERARSALNLVDLSRFADHLPKALSGGMKQRVAIARVLVNDPEVILMDEPFSALDAFTRMRLQYELVKLWEKNPLTVLFVTHNVEEAILLGTRIVVMSPSSQGGILFRDIPINDMPRPRDITSNAFNLYKRDILESLNVDYGSLDSNAMSVSNISTPKWRSERLVNGE